MDDPQTIYLKQLVARYLQAAKDEKDAEIRLNKARLDFNAYRSRKGTFSGTLQEEGIDPDNIPPELLPTEISEPTSTTEVTATDALRVFDEAEASSVRASDNGNAHDLAEVLPLSDTHAIFLIFRRLGNPWLDSDEINRWNLEFGYGLPKSEILRIIGRQIPRNMFLKAADRYKLSEKGLVFNNFRRAPEKQPEEVKMEAEF